MEINYRSQLGRFTCDEWARLWWVRENQAGPASPAAVSSPLRFPRANGNTLTYFVSPHHKGVWRSHTSHLVFTPHTLCVSSSSSYTHLGTRRSSGPVWASLRWCPGRTPDWECSVQNKHTWGQTILLPGHTHFNLIIPCSHLRWWRLVFLTHSAPYLSRHAIQIRPEMAHIWSKLCSVKIFHLYKVKVLRVGLLPAQSDRDEDDDSSTVRTGEGRCWLDVLLGRMWGPSRGLSCSWHSVAIHHICAVHYQRHRGQFAVTSRSSLIPAETDWTTILRRVSRILSSKNEMSSKHDL